MKASEESSATSSSSSFSFWVTAASEGRKEKRKRRERRGKSFLSIFLWVTSQMPHYPPLVLDISVGCLVNLILESNHFDSFMKDHKTSLHPLQPWQWLRRRTPAPPICAASHRNGCFVLMMIKAEERKEGREERRSLYRLNSISLLPLVRWEQ